MYSSASSRHQNAVDIGLFKSPGYHRRDFRLARDRGDVLRQGTIRIPGNYPNAKKIVETRMKKLRLMVTDNMSLKEAIFDLTV